MEIEQMMVLQEKWKWLYKHRTITWTPTLHNKASFDFGRKILFFFDFLIYCPTFTHFSRKLWSWCLWFLGDCDNVGERDRQRERLEERKKEKPKNWEKTHSWHGCFLTFGCVICTCHSSRQKQKTTWGF